MVGEAQKVHTGDRERGREKFSERRGRKTERKSDFAGRSFNIRTHTPRATRGFSAKRKDDFTSRFESVLSR